MVKKCWVMEFYWDGKGSMIEGDVVMEWMIVKCGDWEKEEDEEVVMDG